MRGVGKTLPQAPLPQGEGEMALGLGSLSLTRRPTANPQVQGDNIVLALARQINLKYKRRIMPKILILTFMYFLSCMQTLFCINKKLFLML